MSKSDLPPVPPQGRNKGSQPNADDPQSDAIDARNRRDRVNYNEQGQTGNTHQNTTHQGYQQDR